jgi:hypothetical protein
MRVIKATFQCCEYVIKVTKTGKIKFFYDNGKIFIKEKYDSLHCPSCCRNITLDTEDFIDKE